MSLAPTGVLLIDRNILGVLSCASGLSSRHDSEANSWWINFLNSGHYKLNPVLCAMEGSNRAIPTYEEFEQSFNEACELIQKHLPQVNLVEFTERHYRAAFQTIKDSQERYLNESRFLVEVCPLLAERKQDIHLKVTEDKIFSLCKKNNLDIFSLPLGSSSVLVDLVFQDGL